MFLNGQNVQTIRMSQTFGKLGGENPATSFDKAQDILLNWIGGKIDDNLPDTIRTDPSFNLEELGRPSLRTATCDSIWAFQLAHLDDYARLWTVDATLLRNDKDAFFGTNLFCSVPADTPVPPRTLPIFARTIAETVGLTDYEAELKGTPTYIHSEFGVQYLVGLIKKPSRTRPVFVVSLPQGRDDMAAAAIDPNRLASTVTLLGHTFVLPGDLTFELTDMLGKEWSIFNGAVRTYFPGFDPEKDSLGDHPLTFAKTITDWSPSPAAYARFLFEQAARESVRHNPENKVPSFSRIRQHCLHALMGKAQSCTLEEKDETTADKAKDQIIVELRRENKQVWEECEGVSKQLDEAQSQIKELEADRDRLLEMLAVHQTQGRKFDVVKAWYEVGHELTKLPYDYEGMENWVNQNLADRLVLHPRAVRALKGAVYEDPQLVYKSLLLLACEFRDQYTKGSEEGVKSKLAFQERLRDLHLDNSKTFNNSPDFKTDSYRVNFGGEYCDLIWHLKKGNSFDQRHCFRLYYFYDAKSKRPVVGHLPSHLENRIS